MHLFLDTNVMVGYIFETDNWNSKSIQVIQHSAKKYSCDYALNECGHKYNSKLRRINNEFRHVHRQLIQAKSYKDIETYVQNGNLKTKNVLIKFLNAHKHDSLKNTAAELLNFKIAIEKRCHSNYNYIAETVYFHTSSKPHQDVANKLQVHGFLDEDTDDFEIIIDAHDLGLTISNLLFISGDYTHIVSKKSFILSVTSIKDIIGLGEFNYT